MTIMLQCTPGLQRQAWLCMAMITMGMVSQSPKQLESGPSSMTSTT